MDHLLVDGMNVIGARPDGWWRDRDRAVGALVEALVAWSAADPAGRPVVVVFDGRRPPAFAEAGLEVVFAGRGASADDEMVRRVGADPDPASLTVVTSDRALAERVRAVGAGGVLGAGTFRGALEDGRYCW